MPSHLLQIKFKKVAENKMYSCGISPELSKAFDTEIILLLKKT